MLFYIQKNEIMMIQKIKNILKLFSIKRDKAIYTCLQNDIPLTDENIKEVIEILKQKERIKLLEKFKETKL
jgi:hypothetical protein